MWTPAPPSAPPAWPPWTSTLRTLRPPQLAREVASGCALVRSWTQGAFDVDALIAALERLLAGNEDVDPRAADVREGIRVEPRKSEPSPSATSELSMNFRAQSMLTAFKNRSLLPLFHRLLRSTL